MPTPTFPLLTPTATRQTLARLGLRPRRSLGQNFLTDPNLVRKSLQLARIEPGDTVVEIGPGLGTLTGALLAAGVTLYAVEIDPALAAHLRTEFAGQPSFHLLEGDACSEPLAGYLPGPAALFKVVANLPYAISSPWLEALLQQPVLPSRLVLLVQREAADRLTAQPGSKSVGALTIFLDAAFRRAPGHPVSRTCFFPVPDVDSVLLHLERKPDAAVFPAPIREAIRALFTQRRKQLGALARQFLPPATAAAWLEALVAAGHAPTLRPEQLPFPAWRLLAALFPEA